MDKFIGLQFEHKGRGPKYDCFGLVKYIYKDKLGIELPEYVETYNFRWGEAGKTYILDHMCDDFHVIDRYKKFDLMLFYSPSKAIVNHIGVLLSSDKFIHVQEHLTSSIARIEGYWTNRLYKVIRYGKNII